MIISMLFMKEKSRKLVEFYKEGIMMTYKKEEDLLTKSKVDQLLNPNLTNLRSSQ